VAPAPATGAAAPTTPPAGTPAAGTPPAGTPPAGTPPAPAPLPDAVVQQMVAAVTGTADAKKEALAALVADATHGSTALAQLATRGKAMLTQSLLTFLRRQQATNAIFAGQYAALRDFAPEGNDLLLQWAKQAPREAGNPDQFRTACVRALRDTTAPEAASDALRSDLNILATKAQATRNQDLFLTTVCALQQFGDQRKFDELKSQLVQQHDAAAGDAKLQTVQVLAELHYQARKYADAAAHYQTVVASLEARQPVPQGLPTMVYNAACSLALAGKTDDALSYLGKALEIGKKSGQPLGKALLDTDHDIDSLRQDPRFQELYQAQFGKPAGTGGK
jgi:tetratricopeptide (TPR) repeat protein